MDDLPEIIVFANGPLHGSTPPFEPHPPSFPVTKPAVKGVRLGTS